MRISFFVLCNIILCVGFVHAQAPKPSPLKQAATKVLREMPVKLYEGKATEADVQACLKLIELAPNEQTKRPFILLVAQYQRLALQKPEQTLVILAPHLIGKEKAKAWQKANDEAMKVAAIQWKKDVADAKRAKQEPPKSPSGYLVELPPLVEWTIDEQTAQFAVEAAYCLAAFDKPQKAIEIIDAIGQKYADETRVLAAECGGDLFIQTKLPQRALEFYDFALKVLETLKKEEYEPGKGERIFFSEEQAIILNRLHSKRGVAQHLVDQERYGPDWVAYRNAQNQHFAGQFLNAYFSYEELIRLYPDTVYAEAAECYRIEILCKLADAENVKGQAKIFADQQKALIDAKKALILNERMKSPPAVLENLRTRVINLERRLKSWQQIPTGQAALEMAERETEKFIDRDKLGLYRGEAMLIVGLCWLETFWEPEKAEPWLKRASDWFDEVQKTDAALLTLQVPDKSRAISQAPKVERVTDEWTNTNFSKPKPGDLFNRRECTWYISSKHKDAVLWLGMIAYAKKDFDAAGAWWKKLYEVDPYFKEAESGAFGSTPQRLLWNVKNNKGALFATPAEMMVFRTPRSRFALLYADLEMENANMPAAEKKFRRLLADKEIQSNREMAAYCSYALAVSMICQFKVKEGEAILEKFAPGKVFEKTVVTPRALLHYANCIQDIHDPKRLELKLKCYEYLVKMYSKTEAGDSAMFSQAELFYYLERYTEAIPRLEAYLKKYPNGQYAEIAQEFLKEAKEESKN